MEEQELQDIGPRDVDIPQESSGGEEKVVGGGGGEQVGNGLLGTVVEGDVEKEGRDQNHERTRKVVTPVRSAGDGSEVFELSQRRGSGEVVV